METIKINLTSESGSLISTYKAIASGGYPNVGDSVLFLIGEELYMAEVLKRTFCYVFGPDPRELLLKLTCGPIVKEEVG